MMTQRYVLVILLTLFTSAAYAERVEYIIYDGQNYVNNQLENAANSPLPFTSPYSSGNDYIVPRAMDGHYYISGAVNGFPVVFMVDTGATLTVLPAKFAKNAGIRAGKVVLVDTAAGRARAGLSQGNTILAGPYKLTDAKVGIHDQLHTPLLGMDVLNRFQITQSNGMLILRVAR